MNSSISAPKMNSFCCILSVCLSLSLSFYLLFSASPENTLNVYISSFYFKMYNRQWISWRAAEQQSESSLSLSSRATDIFRDSFPSTENKEKKSKKFWCPWRWKGSVNLEKKKTKDKTPFPPSPPPLLLTQFVHSFLNAGTLSTFLTPSASIFYLQRFSLFKEPIPSLSPHFLYFAYPPCSWKSHQLVLLNN